MEIPVKETKPPGGLLRGKRRTVRYIASALALGMLFLNGVAVAAPSDRGSPENQAIALGLDDAYGTVVEATDADVFADNDVVVEFTDRNLKGCLARVLGVAPTSNITRGDLRSVTELYCGNSYDNLTPLKYAVNLTSLSLWLAGDSAPDLTPLAGLTKLSRLSIVNSGISNIGPLASLTNLKALELSVSPIENLQPLEKLRNLTSLWLNETNVKDLGSLSVLTKLKDLQVNNNSISDLSPLAALSNLESLQAKENSVYDLSPLVGLVKLTALQLNDQSGTLPDTVSGNPSPIPVRLANGSAPPLTVTGAHVIKGDTITWAMPGGGSGYLAWEVTAQIGRASGTFSGSLTQRILRGPDAPAVPTISGSALVGAKLTANIGQRINGAQYTYQWRKDGVSIPSATLPSLTLTMAEYGAEISVVVTESTSGSVPVLGTSAPTSLVKGKPGWFQEKGLWYFFGKDGAQRSGWVDDQDKWYYLNNDGVMLTGWIHIDSTWYFLSANGDRVSGWFLYGGSWYHTDPDGVMHVGWAAVGGTWYYFYSTGEMATGWLQRSGLWYYLKPSGAMATGWASVQGSWYYFNLSGAMTTGWLQLGRDWYYLKPNGEMVIGRYTIDGRVNEFASSGVWLGYR